MELKCSECGSKIRKQNIEEEDDGKKNNLAYGKFPKEEDDPILVCGDCYERP